MIRERADGLIVLPDPRFTREHLVELVRRHRIPAIYQYREFAEAGGLLANGPSLAAISDRAALYVDRILKGAKPGDLPVEQPTTFELVINLKAARELGLTIPPAFLMRTQADSRALTPAIRKELKVAEPAMVIMSSNKSSTIPRKRGGRT